MLRARDPGVGPYQTACADRSPTGTHVPSSSVTSMIHRWMSMSFAAGSMSPQSSHVLVEVRTRMVLADGPDRHVADPIDSSVAHACTLPQLTGCRRRDG